MALSCFCCLLDAVAEEIIYSTAEPDPDLVARQVDEQISEAVTKAFPFLSRDMPMPLADDQRLFPASEQSTLAPVGQIRYDNSRRPELVDPDLLDELAFSGVKYTAEDVQMVTKNSNGMLVWLETGDENAGLTHMQLRHSEDFAKRGIDDIPRFLKEVLDTKPRIVRHNSRGYNAIYEYNGKKYLVAYGTNGFIVSAHPYHQNG